MAYSRVSIDFKDLKSIRIIFFAKKKGKWDNGDESSTFVASFLGYNIDGGGSIQRFVVRLFLRLFHLASDMTLNDVILNLKAIKKKKKKTSDSENCMILCGARFVILLLGSFVC